MVAARPDGPFRPWPMSTSAAVRLAEVALPPSLQAATIAMPTRSAPSRRLMSKSSLSCERAHPGERPGWAQGWWGDLWRSYMPGQLGLLPCAGGGVLGAVLDELEPESD